MTAKPAYWSPEWHKARELVTAILWDVDWDDGGIGKHGRGPFATERQALACLRAVGWPGRVVMVRAQCQARDLERIKARGLRLDR